MRNRKGLGICGLLYLMLAAAPMRVQASPEFTRSEEEWARLRDEVIEYDELEALVSEFNATVVKNRADYQRFRNKHGEKKESVANEYRRLAHDLRNGISTPDVDDPAYGALMAQVIANEQQAEAYEEQADDALEDGHIRRLTNRQTEATLANNAKMEMIQYYQNLVQLRLDEKAQELQQLAYDEAVRKKGLGAAVEADVLSAEEALRNAEQALTDTSAAIRNGRENLIALAGKSAAESPRIGELPPVEPGRIAGMNPEADRAAALEQNYTLLINRRYLENARSEDKKTQYTAAVAENERTIAASLTAAYQNVLSAKTAYDLAVAQAQTEMNRLQAAERRHAAGQMSAHQYRVQVNTTETAQIKIRQAELNLFQAMESYDAAVGGLAST